MNYRLRVSGFLFAALIVSIGQVVSMHNALGQNPEKFPFLIGGYGEGIYLSEFDTSGPSMKEATLLVKIPDASFFCKHPAMPVWYCVSETSSGTGPALIALRASQPLTKLEEINRQDSKGQGPCYVSTDAKGQFAFVANYGSGSVSMFPINYDGSLAPASDAIQHDGGSVDSSRQKGPHAHCAVVDPSDRFVLFNDLGLDKVMVYEIDRVNKKLGTDPNRNVSLPAGSGPRHLAFHPTQNVYYVINELLSTVTVLRWDEKNGTSKIEQTISNLPAGYSGNNSTAEILVHPSGKFVFGSNRGHNSIASYAVNPEDGHLQLVGHYLTGGKTPRNFRIDPTGKYVLAENQQSDSIYILELDETSGELKNTGKHISVPAPACIKFSPE
jgi:6-phosphogluconolactonase